MKINCTEADAEALLVNSSSRAAVHSPATADKLKQTPEVPQVGCVRTNCRDSAIGVDTEVPWLLLIVLIQVDWLDVARNAKLFN
jgi:hypothetical protein